METKSFQLFKAMYKILDEIWENTQAEDLRIYVSDADPIFYENGNSLDPVVFEDFNALFEQKKDSGMSDYDFIVYYLENLDPYYGDIKKYFVSIQKDKCEAKLSGFLK